jgi:DNA-binding MarR family transcriptional regulator
MVLASCRRGGPTLEDILSRPRALRTLVELAKSESVTMTQFMSASGYVWESANALLRELEADGLVQVHERRESGTRIKEISLTDDGRELVQLATRIQELHAQIKARRAQDQ